jgi:hypothetical protein
VPAFLVLPAIRFDGRDPCGVRGDFGAEVVGFDDLPVGVVKHPWSILFRRRRETIVVQQVSHQFDVTGVYRTITGLKLTHVERIDRLHVMFHNFFESPFDVVRGGLCHTDDIVQVRRTCLV